MTHAHEKPESAWAWAEDGCLSAAALTAIADGEEGLFDDSAEWFNHVDQCPGCAESLGHSAARSAEIASLMFAASQVTREEEAAEVNAASAVAREAILADPIVPGVEAPAPVIPILDPIPARPSPVPQRKSGSFAANKPKLPWWGFAAAACVALIGLAPSVQGFFLDAGRALAVLIRVAPSMIRAAPEAFSRAWSPTGKGMGLTWAAAFILLALGLHIGRRASRRSIVSTFGASDSLRGPAPQAPMNGGK